MRSDTVTVPPDTLSASQSDFALPPPLRNAPAGSVYTGGYTEPVTHAPAGRRGA